MARRRRSSRAGGARLDLCRGDLVDPACLSRRRDPGATTASNARRPTRETGSVCCKPLRGGLHRRPPGEDLPARVLARGNQGSPAGRLRRRARPGRPALRARGHLPGAEVWLVCERRSNERKFHVTNHPAGTPLIEVAAAIKARWVCEQGHQQMKEAERMRSGPQPLRVSKLARSTPSRAADDDRPLLPPALAASGKKWTSGRPKPDHRPSQRCPRSANAWFRCSSLSPDPARTVSARFITIFDCKSSRRDIFNPIDVLTE